MKSYLVVVGLIAMVGLAACVTKLPVDEGDGAGGSGGASVRPCVVDADCEEGAPCSGHEACIQGACFPGPGIDLLDALQCTDDLCDPATGVITHPPVKVDDGNICTVDGCTEGKGIWHEPVTDGACAPPTDCHPPPPEVLSIAGAPCANDTDCITNYACYYGGCDLLLNSCRLYQALIGSACENGGKCDIDQNCCLPL